MKSILIIGTGGTIACEDSDAGYSPASPDDLFARLMKNTPLNLDTEKIKVSFSLPFFIDSSDITPEHWRLLARLVYDNYSLYEGFVILHGTDTMQYTAAALTLMLDGLNKPVVLTGSQLPLFDNSTDGYKNFADALTLSANGEYGVYVTFGGRIMSGKGCYKFHTSDLDGFRNKSEEDRKQDPQRPLILRDNLCDKVILIKLTPALSPDILSYIKERGYKGVVLEGFGKSGIPERFLPNISELINSGVRVLFVTSCPEGSAELALYSGGAAAKKLGVEDGKDLTPSFALIKLMNEII